MYSKYCAHAREGKSAHQSAPCSLRKNGIFYLFYNKLIFIHFPNERDTIEETKIYLKSPLQHRYFIFLKSTPM